MRDFAIQRGGQEIFDLLADVNDRFEAGGTREPDKTYEEGIRASLAWLFGETEEHPYEVPEIDHETEVPCA